MRNAAAIGLTLAIVVLLGDAIPVEVTATNPTLPLLYLFLSYPSFHDLTLPPFLFP
jgi:hypothetical protein